MTYALAVIRSGAAEWLAAELAEDLAASTTELVTAQALLEWAMAHRGAMNFDGALFFDVELDAFT